MDSRHKRIVIQIAVQCPIASFPLQPPLKIYLSYFSSVYSTCFYQAIAGVCSLEAADWLGTLLTHVPNFISFINLGCTPERPKQPGKQQRLINDYIHRFTWDVITRPCPNFNEGLAKQPMALGYG